MRVTLALLLLLLAGAAQAEADHYGCRIAYRPPQADYWFGHLLFGCRDDDEMPHTVRFPLGTQALRSLWTLRIVMLEHTGIEPTSTVEPMSATLCDRYWLWAEDEGPRAPEMTRARKLAQACGQ